jgi:phosphoribosylanthranilate isomerase
MQIKVCGIVDEIFIQHLNEIDIQMIGFIFYPDSKRFVDRKLKKDLIATIPRTIQKVGVFVNEDLLKIIEYASYYQLNYIQFHGNESVKVCSILKKYFKVIKAFGINDEFDFSTLKDYEEVCDYFLFDTKTSNYGGSGIKFQWEILNNYKGEIPFLLSGGIQPNDVEAINKINHPQFAGIDINSGFEIKPGIKDIQKIKTFIKEIKS